MAALLRAIPGRNVLIDREETYRYYKLCGLQTDHKWQLKGQLTLVGRDRDDGRLLHRQGQCRRTAARAPSGDATACLGRKRRDVWGRTRSWLARWVDGPARRLPRHAGRCARIRLQSLRCSPGSGLESASGGGKGGRDGSIRRVRSRAARVRVPSSAAPDVRDYGRGRCFGARRERRLLHVALAASCRGHQHAVDLAVFAKRFGCEPFSVTRGMRRMGNGFALAGSYGWRAHLRHVPSVSIRRRP